MIRRDIFDDSCDIEPLPLKSTRIAYLTFPSGSDWSDFDNKKTLRKYYPKKIISIVNVTNSFPSWLKTSAKGLKSLRAEYLKNTKGSISSMRSLEIIEVRVWKFSKENIYDIQKCFRASKRLETLNIRNSFIGYMLRDLKYLNMLRSLDLSILDEHLPALTKIVVTLNALERVSLLFQNPKRIEISDSSRFLVFFEEILSKIKLKELSIDFGRTYALYSSNTFERLFQLIEQSKIEQWSVLAMLDEDEVLGMAEKYRVFRQAKHIAIMNRETGYKSQGLMADYLAKSKFSEKSQKMLNIYTQKTLRTKESFMLDLEGILKQCPHIEHLGFQGEFNLLSGRLGKGELLFQSLKTIAFGPSRSQLSNWHPLIRILESAPFPEKFYLNSHDDSGKAQIEYIAIQEFTNKLLTMNTLKSVGIQTMGASQKTLNTLSNFFENVKGLKELSFEIKIVDVSGLDFIMSRSIMRNLTDLIELCLEFNYSLKKNLENLIDSIPKMQNLQIFKFRNNSGSADWPSFQKLLQIFGRLTQLKELSFYLNILFNLQRLHNEKDREHENNEKNNEDEDDYEETEEDYKAIISGSFLLKKEIRNLLASCNELVFVEVRTGDLCVKYQKYYDI